MDQAIVPHQGGAIQNAGIYGGLAYAVLEGFGRQYGREIFRSITGSRESRYTPYEVDDSPGSNRNRIQRYNDRREVVRHNQRENWNRDRQDDRTMYNSGYRGSRIAYPRKRLFLKKKKKKWLPYDEWRFMQRRKAMGYY